MKNHFLRQVLGQIVGDAVHVYTLDIDDATTAEGIPRLGYPRLMEKSAKVVSCEDEHCRSVGIQELGCREARSPTHGADRRENPQRHR